MGAGHQDHRHHAELMKSILLLLGSLIALPALAQYPSHPVRMIVPFAVGGASDTTARIVAARLSERLNQQIVVDNRTGAGGIIGTDAAAKSAPDGYTLLLGSASEIVMLPAVTAKLPFDPVRDFAPIAMVSDIALVLAAHPSLAAHNVQELIALAKAKPGTINYGSAGVGATSHLAMAMFTAMSGTRMVHVPYKGSAPATADLVAGHLQVGTPTLPAALPYMKGGQLRVLAVTSARRWPTLPNVPTLSESGLPDYEMTLWTGLMAPAGTPPDIVAQLHRETVQVLTMPEVKEAIGRTGGEINTGGPAQFGALIKSDLAKWQRVVKDENIKVD
jgi:tripartite-type tricarboxylate transporter receptor subunit TctC